MFLDEHGSPMERLRFETLEIAIDQAHAICGYPRAGWLTCDVPPLPDDAFDAAAPSRVAS